MATVEQELECFSNFAKQRLSDDPQTSLDDLFDQWRIQHPPVEDALAIQASIRDMENGQTGRPFKEFAKTFRSSNDLPEDQ